MAFVLKTIQCRSLWMNVSVLNVKEGCSSLNKPFCSKIQKYSPADPAKVYDKAVNRKSNVHFNPRQTVDFLETGLVSSDLSCQVKRNIVKQFLDVSI